jgi:OOP family OmpA-OmpF porin
MKQVFSFITLMSLASTVAFSQGNLVQNGSFESVSKKIKDQGSIDLAFPWVSPTETKADLFNPKAKGEDWGVPLNLYGDADPKDGEGYAGIVMYSYKDAEPRTYLEMKLSSGMEEGKVYCVKMSVMLALLSKYACNNIGLYLSEKPMDLEALEAGAITPQIIHSQNKVFTEQFDWEDICHTYIANGGEKYLTIGNFAPSSETQEEKVKKPKGVIGTQARTGYYYIDDVSVKNMAGVDACDCEVDASGSSLQVKYSKEVSSDMELDVTEDIQMTRIYFDEGSSVIKDDAKADMQKVATLLKEHPKYKVKITGHTDPVEEVKVTGDVSLQRAQTVKDQLVKLGAYENKLLVVGVQDFDPATEDASIAGQAQNRRVVFEVISKD